MNAGVQKHAIANAAVRAKTGKGWTQWFTALDKAGAGTRTHREIALLLARQYHLPDWWAQMVTVEYERARGLRVRHQGSDGFRVGVSKTLATGLPHLYAAIAREQTRRKWFPRGALQVSSQTKDKYFRGRWKSRARIEVGFYAKGSGKSQISVQISRLPSQAQVEPARRSWKSALLRLQDLLQS